MRFIALFFEILNTSARYLGGVANKIIGAYRHAETKEYKARKLDAIRCALSQLACIQACKHNVFQFVIRLHLFFFCVCFWAYAALDHRASVVPVLCLTSFQHPTPTPLDFCNYYYHFFFLFFFFKYKMYAHWTFIIQCLWMRFACSGVDFFFFFTRAHISSIKVIVNVSSSGEIGYSGFKRV